MLTFEKRLILTVSYDFRRLQDENATETFQEHLNTKIESLKFDNAEDG